MMHGTMSLKVCPHVIGTVWNWSQVPEAIICFKFKVKRTEIIQSDQKVSVHMLSVL